MLSEFWNFYKSEFSYAYSSCILLASFEYVSNESSTFQMSDNTQNDSRGVGGSGDGPLPAPPPMTPAEAFIAA
jgi:hypothetical protein